jgi:tetratricopeptide (TPR) repeat protein
MTDVAALGYRIDSDDAVKAAGNLDRMSAAAQRADGSAETLSRSTKAAGASMGTASVQARNFGTAIGGAAGQTANMAAQFNDIGVMLAAGQSPLLLALQQGTQINQAFDMMGAQAGTAAGRIGVLRSAFASVISPANLLTIGIIAGGAALAQWAISAATAGRETRTLEDVMEDLEDMQDALAASTDRLALSADELREKYGSASEMVRQFSIAQAEALVAQAQNRLRDQILIMDDVISQYGEAIRVVDEFGESVDISNALSNIRRDLGVTSQEALNLFNAFNALETAGGFEQQQAALQRIDELLNSSGVSARDLPPELNRALIEMRNLVFAANQLAAATERTAEASKNISFPQAAPSQPGLTFGPGMEFGGQLPTIYDTLGIDPFATDDRPSGGGGADPFQTRLDTLMESIATERELLDQAHQENLLILQDRRAIEILGEKEHKEAMLRIEQEYQDALKGIKQSERDTELGYFQSFFGSMADAAATGGDKMLKVSKAFALAEAGISIARGAAKALELPFPANLAAWGTVIATGARALKMIRSASPGNSGLSSGGAPTGVSGSTVAQEPERRTVIELRGEDWIRNIIEPVMTQIYEATRDGERVVFER